MSSGFHLVFSLVALVMAALVYGGDARYKPKRVPLDAHEKRGQVLRVLVLGVQVTLVLFFIYGADSYALPSWWVALVEWSQSTFRNGRQLVGASIVYRNAMPSIYLSTLLLGVAYFLIGLRYFAARVGTRYPVLTHWFGAITMWLLVTLLIRGHTIGIVDWSPYYQRYDEVTYSDLRYYNNLLGMFITTVFVWYFALDMLAKLLFLHWRWMKGMLFPHSPPDVSQKR